MLMMWWIETLHQMQQPLLPYCRRRFVLNLLILWSSEQGMKQCNSGGPPSRLHANISLTNHYHHHHYHHCQVFIYTFDVWGYNGVCVCVFWWDVFMMCILVCVNVCVNINLCCVCCCWWRVGAMVRIQMLRRVVGTSVFARARIYYYILQHHISQYHPHLQYACWYQFTNTSIIVIIVYTHTSVVHVCCIRCWCARPNIICSLFCVMPTFIRKSSVFPFFYDTPTRKVWFVGLHFIIKSTW